jgi:hypothetical protein
LVQRFVVVSAGVVSDVGVLVCRSVEEGDRTATVENVRFVRAAEGVLCEIVGRPVDGDRRLAEAHPFRGGSER